MRDEDRARILHVVEAAEAMAQFVAGRIALLRTLAAAAPAASPAG